MSVPHNYAQTNLQLYAQLHQAGYSFDDLNHIRRTYEFAKELFTAKYKPSGKTFISHLVGTASILGSLQTSKEIVAAGLLHAAYLHGDFGDSQKGISSWKRRQVRLRVGDHTEEYIAKYDAFKWNGTTIPTIRNNFATMGAFDRAVLLMRLANELEEFLDYGILFVGKVQDRLEQYQNWGHVYIELAEQLAYSVLASELRRAFEGTLGELPPRLANLENAVREDRVFTVLPCSFQYSPFTFLRRMSNRGMNHFTVYPNQDRQHPFLSKLHFFRIVQIFKKRIPFLSRA